MEPGLDYPEVTSIDGLNRLALERGWTIRCDGLGRYYLPENTELHAIWCDKAGTGIPPRSAMTARLLQPFLKVVTVHERVRSADGSRRFLSRLMGNTVAGDIGDGSRKFYEEFLPASALPVWNAMSDVTLGHGGPVRFLVRAEEIDKPHMVGELFSAPLTTEDGRADLILSGGGFNAVWTWDEIVAHWQQDIAASA